MVGENGITQEQKKVVEVISTFACPYCGTGGERYSEVFQGGKCRACAAPLEKFQATISEIGKDALKRSLFIISGPDVKDQVGQMIKELSKNGINTVTAEEIIQGTQINEAPANLVFIMRNTLATLVVGSPQLESDPAIKACLGSAVVEGIEGEEKFRLVPLLLNKDSKKYLPAMVALHYGVGWGFEPEGRLATTKQRFIKQMKQEIAEIEGAKS